MSILLQQESRAFYRNLGAALMQEAKRQYDAEVEPTLEYLGDLSPDNVATRLITLAKTCKIVA